MAHLNDGINDATARDSEVAQSRDAWDGGAAQGAPGAPGAGSSDLVGFLLSGMGGTGGSPFGGLPELSQMLRGFSGLSGMQNATQEFAGGFPESTPFPWSQECSGISSSLFNDPAEADSNLSSVVSKLSHGIHHQSPGGLVPVEAQGGADGSQSGQTSSENAVRNLAEQIQNILEGRNQLRGPNPELQG